ncbi:Methylmalonyl-CoA carboxyltransferase 5S subunit [Citrobacter freundii]|nr:Methylmalonyl-CoA carboxyltransferase 5S subunit [Citrobacter freundii]
MTSATAPSNAGGGATYDACIRFLGEDPWVRLRELKKAMPKTPLQMLLRGQNLLGLPPLRR